MRRVSIVALLLALAQTSCVVAGYSNRGGWFLWPGSLTILVIIAIVLLLSRRRRG